MENSASNTSTKKIASTTALEVGLPKLPEEPVTRIPVSYTHLDVYKRQVGVQVLPEDRGAFCEFLEKLGYEYWDETENPAYQRFLG